MSPPLKPPLSRVFIASSLDARTRRALAAIQQSLGQAAADVKWVAPEKIHLTFLFLGDVAESRILSLASILDDVGRAHQGATLEIYGLGYFGRRFPRIIWAGLRGASQPLIALRAALVAGCRALSFAPDSKPWQPHLTLGRMRSPAAAAPLSAALAEREKISLGRLTITHLQLIKSQLTPLDPRYTILHESPLARA